MEFVECVQEYSVDGQIRCLEVINNHLIAIGKKKEIKIYDFMAGQETFCYDSPFGNDCIEMMIYYPSEKVLLLASFDGVIVFLDPLTGSTRNFYNQDGLWDHLGHETCIDGLLFINDTSCLLKIEYVCQHQSLVILDWRKDIKEATEKVKEEEYMYLRNTRFGGRGSGRRKINIPTTLQISKGERNLSKQSVRKLEYVKGIPKSRCVIAIMGMDYFPKQNLLLFTTYGSSYANLVSISTVHGDLDQRTLLIKSPKWESVRKISDTECVLSSQNSSYGIFDVDDWNFKKIILGDISSCEYFSMIYFHDRMVLLSVSDSGELQIFKLQNDYTFECIHKEKKKIKGFRKLEYSNLKRGVFFLTVINKTDEKKSSEHAEIMKVYSLTSEIVDHDEFSRIEYMELYLKEMLDVHHVVLRLKNNITFNIPIWCNNIWFL